MTRNEAYQFRKLLEKQSDQLSDEEILQVPVFVEHWQTNTIYEVGKRVNHNGIIYKCLTAHTSQDTWTPEAAPSLWAKVLIPDPGIIPEWEQPDSTNTYSKGDKVTHNGKIWVSDVDNNSWEPGVYGWSEV